jgi:hypothetical protein
LGVLYPGTVLYSKKRPVQVKQRSRVKKKKNTRTIYTKYFLFFFLSL